MRRDDMKIVFTFDPPDHLKKTLQSNFSNVQFYFFHDVTVAEQEMKTAEVIVTYGEDLNDEHIRKAENLQWIMVTSAGLERMPLKIISERNILITNARGVHKIPMAEFTMGLILDYVKSFQRLWNNQKEMIWDKSKPLSELNGQTLLIVGAGAIGQEIARLAKAFGMKVYGVNSSGMPKEYFDEMFTLNHVNAVFDQVDFLVSLLPSTEKTVGFYKKTDFEKMKSSLVFINIGRGDVVEEEILIDALNNHQIAHAYLDVFEQEPLSKGHPFWTMDNVSITPHISSTTRNYLPRALDIFEKNLHTYINNVGQLINVIDPERGY